MGGFRLMLAGAGTAALVAGLLAIDPPAPREAGAYSFQPPAAKAGDPPGNGTCAECHFGGLNTGDGSLSISAPAAYMPGQQYTITVTLQDPGQTRWGFELTALTSAFQMAGSLASADTLTKTQVFFLKTYVSHTSNGINNQLGTSPLPNDGTYWQLADGPASWTFRWTAPPSGTGTVTFYAAGNAANGNGTNGAGDFIYTKTATSQEAVTAVVQTTWGALKKLYR